MGSNVGKVLQFVHIGLVVDTIHKRLSCLVFGHLADVLGHLAVSQQHKLFDELVGVLSLMNMNGSGFSLFVDVKLDFLAVERH